MNDNCGGDRTSEQWMRRMVTELGDSAIDRWSASASILKLVGDLTAETECWTEHRFARDGDDRETLTVGTLAMLIDPGSSKQSGERAIDGLEILAGVSYMVIGRALFGSH